MEDLTTIFHPKHYLEDLPRPPKYSYYGECIICEKRFSFGSVRCYCRVCDFKFHRECANVLMKSNLTINRPETHEHTLTFIRQKNSFNCDACGKVGKWKMNTYACLLCNFFVHRECIDLPKVIKLTRHSHRLVHTFQVLDWNEKCRICNSEFVSGCGGYICINKTCGYKLHSYCATSRERWDGKEVQGEAEEISNPEGVASLEEVDGKTFRHFSHQHDLTRLCVNDDDEEDGGIRCEACVLPIEFGCFLACKECDFALHDACVSLPRNLEHTLHRHQLTLEVNKEEGFFKTERREGFFICYICGRESCGFMYRCYQKESKFEMDATCASLTDPLHYGGHSHPMTLLDTYAHCFECGFVDLMFQKVTLPSVVKCKYDTHPLTICSSHTITEDDKSAWCEICEVQIIKQYDDLMDLYGCTICNTIVHVECAIGKYPFLKPGHTIKVNGFEIEIASNTLSRPICRACHSTCLDKLVFKNKTYAVTFCYIRCVTSSSSKSKPTI
ncbi:unnamed protein product [Microthlaspi erraticum]|uniref:Phorbol-ester/DAG-type domain-containing protein n=1 Tax=Microthlaspi erraticum TaxID=1685480 RepID=A0A6D2HK05_9BRAS|nr:unnamed protein product [Microthlaspi erraticum]